MLTPGEAVRLDKIKLPALWSEKYQLLVLRLDLIDKITGGNKHFKLRYNLEEAKRLGHKRILTFGGAWSNHLAAVAESVGGRRTSDDELEVIAVVRGEEPEAISATLRFCLEKGVRLHFVSREDYRRRNDPDFIEGLKEEFGDFYLLPEGGSNDLAVKGCREILDLIKTDFNVICCPVGSGGTLAGIAGGLKEHQQALGFVALKGAEYLEQTILQLAPEAHGRFKLVHDYHFGGFAKTTPQLVAFKKEFEKKNGFELDYVYTSKMFFGIFDLLEKNYFTPGSTIIAVHTGGLQGNQGFESINVLL